MCNVCNKKNQKKRNSHTYIQRLVRNSWHNHPFICRLKCHFYKNVQLDKVIVERIFKRLPLFRFVLLLLWNALCFYHYINWQSAVGFIAFLFISFLLSFLCFKEISKETLGLYLRIMLLLKWCIIWDGISGKVAYKRRLMR